MFSVFSALPVLGLLLHRSLLFFLVDNSVVNVPVETVDGRIVWYHGLEERLVIECDRTRLNPDACYLAAQARCQALSGEVYQLDGGTSVPSTIS